MRAPLTGVIPPMVTPLRGRDELDVSGLERLIEHIVAGNVAGVFILGTTGEGPSLSHRLRRELIRRACRLVHGRIPVLVGITDTAFAESVALARHAATAGADALVLAPPCYFREGQPELQEYLEHLVAEVSLPLFLYNAPANTKVEYGLDVLRRVLEEPRVIGLKDSSRDMRYFRDAVGLIRQRPDFSLFMGPEELLADGLLAGAHGGVPGGANLFPRLYVQLCEAARNGDEARCRQLQAQVLRICGSLYQIGRHPSAVIKGIKCALACLGVCDDFMAEPFHRFRARERIQVQAQLAELVAEVEELVSDGQPAAGIRDTPRAQPASPGKFATRVS